MKEYYENIPKTKLMRRCPVALRIDGKAFHTFTKGFKRPFDDILNTTMQQTMKYLCENIQGCALGYTQSDEITLILIDYQTLTTSAWFDYEVQKLCSVGASMATMRFNQEFRKQVLDYCGDHIGLDSDEAIKYSTTLQQAVTKGAMFDCRCFNVPKEEVTNLILWRQLDATRNSIEMIGRAYFSHKELMYKNTDKIQDMLYKQFNVNWNDFPTKYKRGSACIKDMSGHWFVDNEMPILKNEDREYIEKLIYTGE